MSTAQSKFSKPIQAEIPCERLTCVDLATIAERAGDGVSKIALEGRDVWIKRAASKVRPLHRVQRAVAMLLRQEILRPTASRGGSAALRREAEKAGAFRQAGILAPLILQLTPDTLVMSDIGRTLVGQYLKGEKLVLVLEEAARALGRAHAAGLVHGRPSLRDLVWTGEEIGFIDFEEAPEEVMALEMAQARDLCLFLMQAGRYGGPRALERSHLAYEPFLTAPVKSAVVHVTRSLQTLASIFRRPILRFGSRDAVAALHTTEFLIRRFEGPSKTTARR